MLGAAGHMTLAEVGGDPLASPKGARKSWTIYQALKRQIILGDLTPDSPITEQALAAEFGSSQGTVREALLSLQEDGLVDRRGYQGTYVTRTTDEEAIVLVRLRLSLECAGMERAIARLAPESEQHLRQLASRYMELRANRDVFACAELDRAFHTRIFELADMPMLEPILSRTLLQLHRYTLSRHHGNIFWKDLAEDPHMAIVDVMKTGSVEEAKLHIGRHIACILATLAPEVHDMVFRPLQHKASAEG
jgi:GntR family transcriptional regulator, rspAB operon transcriptional repressor